MSQTDPRSEPVLRIELFPLAFFGKRDGASDYAWLQGREAVSSDLASLCETLAAWPDTPVSLTESRGELTFLVRSFRNGVDSAFRPVMAVEILRVLGPAGFSPEDLLRLTSASFSWEQSPQTASFAVEVHPVQIPAQSLDPELASRARLGLPVSVSPAAAVAIVRRRPWRYRGICFARRSEASPRWCRELAPYLCISFTPPPLTEKESVLLRSALDRPPSQAEWEALDGLAAEQVERALEWARTGDPPSLSFSPADPLLSWRVAFLAGERTPGPFLLDAALRDPVLRLRVVELLPVLAGGLSADALSFLAALFKGEETDATFEVAEELAQAAYLILPDCIPLRLWAGWVELSSLLERSAIEALGAAGAPAADARFVLDLEPTRRESESWLPQIESVRLAVRLGLEPPHRRLSSWLRKLSSARELERFGEIAQCYGGRTGLLGDLIQKGRLAEGGDLADDEIVAGLQARYRGAGDRPLLAVIADLLARGRAEVAQRILENIAGDPALQPGEWALEVLRSRLGGAGPARPPAELHPLAELVRLGLARPADITPGPAQLASCADFWPETRPLLGLLDAESPPAPDLPMIPDAWAPAMREAVTPGLAQSFLARLPIVKRGQARAWLVTLQDLTPTGIAALWGGNAPQPERESLQRGLPWVAALLAGEERPLRLQALATAAQSRWVQGNEDGAALLAEALLPGEGEATHEMVIHALSGLGPLPPLGGVAGDLIGALLQVLDAVAVADALFTAAARPPEESAALADRLADRLKATSANRPPHDYTRRQMERHPILIARLGELRGWQEIVRDDGLRRALARRVLQQLGLGLEDFPASPSGGPVRRKNGPPAR